MCGGMLEKIREKPLPLITTFYAPAIAADIAGYGRVYCVICDAEVNRAWVAENPRTSKIVYLAPCGRAVRRLNQYGVPQREDLADRVSHPRGAAGRQEPRALKWDFGQRLRIPGPTGERFWPMHGLNVQHFLGAENCRLAKKRVLTITFGVGGAGAQTDIALYDRAQPAGQDRQGRGELQHPRRHQARGEGLPGAGPQGARPSADLDRLRGRRWRNTSAASPSACGPRDVLWTKPSELSFYCGLGIPDHHGATHRLPGGLQSGVAPGNPGGLPSTRSAVHE